MEDTRPESLQEVGTCCAHSRGSLRAPRALTTQRSQEWGEKGPLKWGDGAEALREAACGREQGHAHQEQGGAPAESHTCSGKQGHGTQREATQETGLLITQSCQSCPISTRKGALPYLRCVRLSIRLTQQDSGVKIQGNDLKPSDSERPETEGG